MLGQRRGVNGSTPSNTAIRRPVQVTVEFTCCPGQSRGFTTLMKGRVLITRTSAIWRRRI
jgi:hypothetical protein